ncbi:MAG: bifunctional pyr operon transcriptional regulator/uracil phosphoribosyltransferase PyrR [Rhodocyclaceae bacterium]|jgi:pyrimidine operon attenuation protein/uracil phosphoribosyltransferase|nr:bifunctional pyr operon transcriptional regulator/uracil phosphoribosyltransferase PyrR [Rhodocyclaceae bacterium]MBK6554938.1 bifunctional pyr operon transcriptional regulator/uracil phosphoribosyltransferase PyrR [Rhodocyclaceae bacterium]MBK6677110.1 bifunctional pyr operon transcriptional regulator/uracil phosphoribosyltransferase PyrR [Rhodocyclaceae bacterium]MBK7816057.1 bifunctional pyr operon transcriptional regulator/uracil phosphoribosyltransferase PyrR [Rhodocyclaceae bacterium]M
MNTVKPAAELLGQLAEAMRPAVTPDTVLVGIYTGGVWIAEWLRDVLGVKAAVGSIDVSYHRDDHHLGGGRGGGKASQLRFDVEGAHVVIVDDVLATGRTIRAAMNELFDYGRPARIDLAVLVDRGGRELPIAARWMAQTVSLPASQTLELTRNDDGELAFRVTEK